MKSLIFSAVAVFAFSDFVAAESVSIRSAEHEDFTRVVFDTVYPDEVTVRQKHRSLIVSFSRATDGITFDGFFRRISRKKILNVSIDEETQDFEIQLACDCGFNAFVSGESMFVVDLRDERAIENSESLTFGLQSMTSNRGSNRPTLSFSVLGDQSPVPKVDEPKKDRVFPVVFPKKKKVTDARNINLLSDFRANTNHIANNVQQDIDNQIAFRSKSTMQRAELQNVETEVARELNSCTSTNHINPSTWPKYEEASSFLNSQIELISGDGPSDSSSLRLLALGYLSLAMGAEARALLEAIPEPTRTDLDQIVLSKFFDEELDKPLKHEIREIEFCEELAVLKILGDTIGDKTNFNGKSLTSEQKFKIQSDFDSWPRAVHSLFVAHFAEGLLYYGVPDVAEFSLRRFEGNSEESTGATAVAAAKIAEHRQEIDQAVSLLETVISNDADDAPNAIIAMTDIFVQHGESISTQDKNALRSYQEEYEGTELEANLIRASLRAAIQDGEIDSATKLMIPYSKLVRKNKIDMVVDEIGEAIYSASSDAVFLREAISFPNSYYKRLSVEIQEKISSRMIGLGFADLSSQLGNVRGTDEAAVDQNSEAEPTFGEENSKKSGDQDSDFQALSVENIPKNVNEDEVIPQNLELPLARAVRETSSILEEVGRLKAELETLGL